MATTIVLALIMMAGYFLMLYSAVALVQDKKYFTSAPKEIQEAVLPKEERFPGAHFLGRNLLGLALAMLIFPVFFGGMDGIQNRFTFAQFLIRFIIMTVGLEVFDILFFDWVLLCHSNFFPLYYPEVKDLVGPHLFGFNMKQHAAHIAGFVIFSIIFSLICSALVK